MPISNIFTSFSPTCPFVTDMMTRQHYGTPKTILYEYLVRACELRYLLAHDLEEVANMWLQYSRTMGFLWIEELVELLDRYEKERDKYPMLDDFMPEIVKLQNALVTDESIAELRKRAEIKENERREHSAPE